MSKQKFYGLLDAGFTSAYLEEEPTRIGERVLTRCPRCSDSRTNKKQKCAQVTAIEGGWNWYCHQCEAGKGEFISNQTKEQELDAWKRANPQSPKNAQNSAYKTQSNTNTKQMQDTTENTQNNAPKVKPAKVASQYKY